jgi:hypothetical protein
MSAGRPILNSACVDCLNHQVQSPMCCQLLPSMHDRLTLMSAKRQDDVVVPLLVPCRCAHWTPDLTKLHDNCCLSSTINHFESFIAMNNIVKKKVSSRNVDGRCIVIGRNGDSHRPRCDGDEDDGEMILILNMLQPHVSKLNT